MLNDIYHHLDPVAISLGPIDIRWYGLAYIFGFICTGIIMYRVARRWKLNLTIDDVMFVIVCVSFGVIIGARLFYVIFYGVGSYWHHPLDILKLNEGGMSFHGGLVGAIVGGLIGSKMLGLNPLTIADLAAIGAPSGLFFGRIANFINGELWGKPTDFPWGVVFQPGGVARHPSQLYEAVLEGLVILLVLYVLSRRMPPRPQGTFIGLFMCLYGVFRFLVEYVRVPDAQLGYLFGFITMGQCLSLPLIVLGIIMLIWSHKRQHPQQGKMLLAN